MVYLDVPSLNWLNVKLYNDVDNIVLGKKSPEFIQEKGQKELYSKIV